MQSSIHTDSGSVSAARPATLLAVYALFLLLYLLPGIIGHDPWKQDETYTFGIIHHMLQSGDLVVPFSAGQPFLEKPPLFYWTGALLAFLCSPWLPLHDAARIASFGFGIVTFLFVGLSARRAVPARSFSDLRVVGTIALFGGSLLVVKSMHDLCSDVALLAGAAIALYGMQGLAAGQTASRSQSRRSMVRDAALLGLGTGIAQMSKGLFIPLVLGACVALLPLLLASCRRRAYLSGVGIALLVFTPFAVIWPALLAQRSVDYFNVWFWQNNVGRFFGFSVQQLGSANDSFVVLRALLGTAFPAGPLALWAVCRGGWRRWREPSIAVPLLFCVIGIGTVSVSATARQVYLLPFMPALALLAGTTIARTPLRAATAWDYLSRVAFGVLAVIAWGVWLVMMQPANEHGVLAPLGRWLPLDYIIRPHPIAIVTAMALTLWWCLLLPALSHAGRWRGALSWLSGITMVWGLIFTLLLPWLNHGKSYGPVFRNLHRAIAPAWRPADCMESVELGESEAPMLLYFAGITARPIPAATGAGCGWLIIEHRQPNAPKLDDAIWKQFWRGTRDGDSSEVLTVYRRKEADVQAP